MWLLIDCTYFTAIVSKMTNKGDYSLAIFGGPNSSAPSKLASYKHNHAFFSVLNPLLLLLNYNFGPSDVKLQLSRGLSWSPSMFPIIPLSSLTWPHNLLPSLTNSEHLWSTKFVTFDTRDCASVRALKRENNHYWNEQFRHLRYNLYQLNCQSVVV